MVFINENISAFISYSHDNPEHCAWVLSLATHLRGHGIDVILDVWNLRMGEDLAFFMEHELNRVKYVLCICSENYVHKANGGSGGVGYEKMIMTQELLSNANDNSIIPIVRNNTSLRKTPIFLGSKVYIDFSNDDRYFNNYWDLLTRLYNQDIARIPPIGKNPFDNSLKNEIDIKTSIERGLYIDPSLSGNITFRYDNNDGVFTLGTGEYSFSTRWSRSGNDSIHAYGDIGFIPDAHDIPCLSEIEHYDFTSRVRTIRKGQIVIWKNSNNHFAAVRITSVKSSSHGFPYDEMEFEYKIFTTE